MLFLRLYHLLNDWFDRLLPKLRYTTEEIESPTAVFAGIMRYNDLPMSDIYELFADNLPGFKIHEVRLSIYSKGNYLALKIKITRELLSADFTITTRQYINHEDDTKYHHYTIDVTKT